MPLVLNKKTSTSKTIEESKIWKIEHIQGNSFVVILLDEILNPQHNQTDAEILRYLEGIIANTGIQSYVITSAISVKTPNPMSKSDAAKEAKSLGKLGFYNKYDTHWYEEIVTPYRAKGLTVDTVVAFGPAFYQCLQSSEDISIYDLFFPYLRNYVYQGHGFQGDLGMFNHQKVKDMFIFPMFTTHEIFIPSSQDNWASTKVELGAWRLRYMVTILRKIALKDYRLPDNMEPCVLVDLDSKEKILEFLDKHMGEEDLAIDTETSGLDFTTDFIRCVQVAFDEVTGYYMEWKDVSDPQVFPKFVEFLLSCKNVITQNGKFDIKFLWQNGVPQTFKVTEDAMEMAHVLCSDRKKGLKTQSYMYTPYGGYDNQLDTWRDKQKKLRGGKEVPYSDAPKAVLFPYATMDPIQTMRNYYATMKDIKQFAIDHPTTKPVEHMEGHSYTPYDWYHDYVMPLYQHICRTEYQGMYLDEEVMNKHRQDLMDIENDLRDKLVDIFRDEYGVNISRDYEFTSTTKLGQLLEKAGWPCHGMDKKEATYKTADEQFAEWIKRDKMKGAKELQTLRQACNGYGTYIGTLETTVDKKTGRIKKDTTGWLKYARKHEDGSYRMHCNFGVCLNTTFRCRTSEPNLQNLPTRGEIAPYVKQCLTVPPADMYHFTTPSGKKYDAAEVEYVHVKNHPSGQSYVEARFLKGLENTDCEIDEAEPVVLSFEEGLKLLEGK